MSNYGYGRQNPYDQRGDGGYSNGGGYSAGGGYDAYGAPPSQGYGRQQYNAPTMGRDEYDSTYRPGNQNVEMEPLAPNGQQFGRQNDPNYIFQECADIKKAVTNITTRELSHVQSLQNAVLNDPDTSSASPNSRELQSKTAQVMDEYRSLAQRVKKLKTNPESGAPRFKDQVGSTGRAVQQAINQFQQLDGQFNKKLKEQMARQYRIVRPEASDEEVRDAVNDTEGQQVFSQALLQGDRRGQSRSALSAVQGRHEAIQKIERQMIELAELFQDMENLVVQQEAAVTNIEMKGEEVVENMDKGTEEIGTAVKTARATRKKKWWCLGISVLIIVIVVVIILLWQFVFGPNAKSNRDNTKPAKRWVLPPVDAFALPAAQPFISSLELVRKAKRFEA